MKRPIALLVALAALAAPAGAAAHPLGNYTVNRYSELVVSGTHVYVRYVLDLAEIPTFQARQAGGIRADALIRRVTPTLELRVNGTRKRLVPVRRGLSFLPGAGGLRTARLEAVLAGPALPRRSRLAYRDRSFAGRIGWKEVVVRAERGARLLRSTAPMRSVSQALQAYPDDLLSSPLDVGSARATVEPGPKTGVAPTLTTGRSLQAPDRRADSGFASLIERGDLSLLVVIASLGVALFWGAAHALGPGHGKSIVAAYLIGQRGTVRHALSLGAIVTVTHTIGVYALGLVTLALSELVVPEDLYPWLSLVAGVMVVAVGASVLRSRLRHRLHRLRQRKHDHDHHHHAHDQAESLSFRSLLAVGVSGGILPCPSALVVLLAAISLHRVAYGLALIVAFSLGLALTITAIGLVAVLARRTFSRMSLDGPLVRLLPVASALVILVAGVVMTARALPEVS